MTENSVQYGKYASHLTGKQKKERMICIRNHKIAELWSSLVCTTDLCKCTDHSQFHRSRHHNHWHRCKAGRSQCSHDLHTWTDQNNTPVTVPRLQYNAFTTMTNVCTDEYDRN